jgi:Coenzyme PQQ synthesis protein D (PqqD)
MDHEFTETTVLMVTKQQVSCDLGEEAAILNLKNNVYYGLNPVGARIWRLLKEPKTVAEIRDSILCEYDVAPQQLEDELVPLLEKLWSEGLVELRREAD